VSGPVSNAELGMMNSVIDRTPGVNEQLPAKDNAAISGAVPPKVNDTAMIMIDSTADTVLLTMPDSGPVKKSISFDEILPLSKRQRPIAKFQRQKPPSFELTGNDTMQFVRDRTVKKKEPKSKSRRK
jgi:hypothetical protein